MDGRNEYEARVLVLAPIGRDATLIAETLCAAGICAVTCPDFNTLFAWLKEGAAAVVVAQEGLSQASVTSVAAWLTLQPPWSDLPFIVLTSGGKPNSTTISSAQKLEALGNVTLLERPVRPDTIRSSVRAALRARHRQYEMRFHQEKLTHANRDLEQFAHSASHDLREPLRTVSIYSEILADRYRSKFDDDGLLLLGYLRSGAVRMEMLIRDLLAYTQAAAIEEETQPRVEACEQLEIALENLTEAINSSGASVTHDNLPAVAMKGVHLQQIFQNLLGNAIKYRRDEKPEMHVSAAIDDGYWRFSVSDNGIGIEPQFRELIFGIFKRLHGSDKFSGTGIGLAICKRIMERYGGRIWVESEFGKGSTFFFTVPA
jgi:signal transduction histidine kinase